MSKLIPPIDFVNDKLFLLDQRLLPNEEVVVEVCSIEATFDCIKDMVVRGAPCIGFTAIFGMALGIQQLSEYDLEEIEKLGEKLGQSRPTAVNLKFEIQEVLKLLREHCPNSIKEAYSLVVTYGREQIKHSGANNKKMAIIAENELEKTFGDKKLQILTHCNTGYLACGSMGTALGVIENLNDKKKLENVWVDETRPYMQGSRLTAYELGKLEIDYKIITEGCASFLMSNGHVDAVFTGADRIVANGDTANKVGTSNLAVLCNYYNIPFYIVAPSSSFDLKSTSGEEIEIEFRDETEILNFKEYSIAPTDAKAFNPSFDVTDSKLITGIISEKGIAKGDYLKTLKDIV